MIFRYLFLFFCFFPYVLAGQGIQQISTIDNLLVGFPFSVKDTVLYDVFRLDDGIISKPVNFDRVKFAGGVSVEHNTFENRVKFANSSFFGETWLTHISFRSEVNFLDTDFSGNLNLPLSQFYSELRIENCTFGDVLRFDESSFFESPDITNVVLPDTLSLRYLNLDSLKGKLDFSYCRLKKSSIRDNRKCILLLDGTDLSKLVIPSALFSILDSDFYKDIRKHEKFEIHEKVRLDQISQIYERIIKLSIEQGQMSNAEGWDIEYRSRKNSILLFGNLLNYINDMWWKFGYEKWRIFWIWLPLFYIIFSLIIFLKTEWFIEKVYHDKELGTSFNLSYRREMGTLERLAYSLFITAIIYFNFKLKYEAVNYKNFYGFLLLSIIHIVGTIHVTFGILGYILKV